MMPKWHYLDSSRARSALQDSVKKNTLELYSRPSQMQNIDFLLFLACILDTILNISKCSMMPKWHHLDSSTARFAKQDSVKKKTLELNSRSSLNSALFYRTMTTCLTYSKKAIIEHIKIKIKRVPLKIKNLVS